MKRPLAQMILISLPVFFSSAVLYAVYASVGWPGVACVLIATGYSGALMWALITVDK